MSRRIIQQLASHLDGSGFYRQLPIVYLDQYSGGVGRGCSGAAIASLISSLTSSHCPGSSRPGPGTSAHTGSGSRGRDHGGEVARARVTASWRSRPRARGSSLKAGVLSARTVMAPPRLVTISRPRRAPAWLAASPAPRRCSRLVGAAPPRATSCQFRSCDWLAGVRWAGPRVTSVHPSSWLLFTAAGGAAADIFPFFEWAGLCYLGAGRHIAGVRLWVRTNNGLTILSTTRYNLK